MLSCSYASIDVISCCFIFAILVVDTVVADDALAIVRLVELLIGRYRSRALLTSKALFVVVLLVKDQVGLSGQDLVFAFGARLGFLLGEAVNARWLVVLVHVDADAGQLL